MYPDPSSNLTAMKPLRSNSAMRPASAKVKTKAQIPANKLPIKRANSMRAQK